MSELETKVKLTLRLRSEAFDAEVTGLIAAAKADLRLVGIVFEEGAEATGDNSATAPPLDPLVERAIILYCKAHFGYIEGGERFLKAYDNLKCALSLAGGF